MGITFSKGNNIKELEQDIKKLVNEYNFWVNENICDKIEVVYYDKLIKFRKKELIGLSTAVGIGYKINENYDKPLICREIIYHYRKRINLLNSIYEGLNNIAIKINSLNNGPMCIKTNKYIDDIMTCRSFPDGLWVNKDEYKNYINELKKNNLYGDCDKWRKKLDKAYKNILLFLTNVVNRIKKDNDYPMEEEEFEAIYTRTMKRLNDFNTLSEIYYLLAINCNNNL